MVSHGLGLIAAILGTLKVGAIPLVITDENDPRTTCLDEYCQLLLSDTIHIESLLSREINVPPTLVLNTAALTSQGVTGIVLRKSIHLPSFDGYDKISLYHKRRALVTHDVLNDCLVQHQNDMCLRCDTEGQLEGTTKDVIPLWRITDEVNGWHDNISEEPQQPITETHVESNSSNNLNPSSTHHLHHSALPTPHTTSSSAVVQQHICQLIQHIKGRKPPPSASFSAIGVDSLGSVVFVRRLSDTLGGVKITPEDIYDPGVTIQSFATVLTRRLAREQPYVLHQLVSKVQQQQQQQQRQQQQRQQQKKTEENGTFDQEQGNVDSSVDKGYHNNLPVDGVDGNGDGDGDATSIDIDRDVLAWDRHFDRVLASNRLLFEGLRGACSLLVLYDHFHDPSTVVSDALAVDTYLFVVLSGFTTALQCRQTPKTKPPSSSAGSSDHANCPNHDHGSHGKGKSQMMNTSVLLSRPSFPLGSFLFSRALGLLPILWIAILLNIPPWHQQTLNDVGTPISRTVCAILYPIGMQSWYRPACHEYGPNNLLYASLLINICIIYGVGRKYVIEPVQNLLMSWSDPKTLARHPLTLQPQQSPQHNLNSLSIWIGNITTLLAYNRITTLHIGKVTIGWIVFTLSFSHLMWRATFAKNALVFIPYFLIGIGTAAWFESFQFAVWISSPRRKHLHGFGDGDDGSRLRWLHQIICSHRKASNNNKSSLRSLPSSSSTSEGTMFTLLPGDDEREDREVFKGDDGDGRDGGKGIAMMLSSSVDRRDDDSATDDSAENVGIVGDDVNQEEGGEEEEGEEMTCWISYGRVIWRFLPDILTILLLICLSPLIIDKEIQGWLWFVVIPFLFLAIVTLSMSQQDSAQINITRYFLESWPMTVMGYASYPLYLFQRIIFTFYLPLIYIGTLTHHYDMYIGNEDPWRGGPWFEQLPFLVKIFCMAMLSGLCYVVQMVVQDHIVTRVYLAILKWSS